MFEQGRGVGTVVAIVLGLLLSALALREFKGLQTREKILTVFACIAFPTDVVSLLDLLSRTLTLQSVGSSVRPDAINVRLPAFIWDTRLADALSL